MRYLKFARYEWQKGYKELKVEQDTRYELTSNRLPKINFLIFRI